MSSAFSTDPRSRDANFSCAPAKACATVPPPVTVAIRIMP